MIRMENKFARLASLGLGCTFSVQVFLTLGEGQPLQAFGYDIIKCGKGLHACCYEACKINLKDKETLAKRNDYHNKALEYCDSIFRQIDLCIY